MNRVDVHAGFMSHRKGRLPGRQTVLKGSERKQLGDAVEAWTLAHDVTLEVLAERIGISRTTLWHWLWENPGKQRKASLDTVERMLAILGMPSREIVLSNEEQSLIRTWRRFSENAEPSQVRGALATITAWADTAAEIRAKQAGLPTDPNPHGVMPKPKTDDDHEIVDMPVKPRTK